MENDHFEVLKSLLIATKSEIIATIDPVIRDQKDMKLDIEELDERVELLEKANAKRTWAENLRSKIYAACWLVFGIMIGFVGNLLSGGWHPFH